MHTYRFLLATVVIVLGGVTSGAETAPRTANPVVPHRVATGVHCTGDGSWCVRRQSGSHTCHLQLITASPLGEDYLGPFTKKIDGAKAMCAAYDPTFTDQSKCWSTLPAGTCPNSSDKASDKTG